RRSAAARSSSTAWPARRRPRSTTPATTRSSRRSAGSAPTWRRSRGSGRRSARPSPRANRPPSTATSPAAASPRGGPAARACPGELRFVPPELARLDEIDCEVLACTVWSDVRPSHGLAGLCDWRLGGRLSDLERRGLVTGALGEVVLVPGKPRLTFDKLLVF